MRKIAPAEEGMKLEGIHHITAITAEAQRNVDFYAGTLGLRLVKKTVNQDQPTSTTSSTPTRMAARRSTSPSSSSPAAPQGRAGEGMVHTIVWRVASTEALDFWAAAPGRRGLRVAERLGDALRFNDPEGLEHELAVVEVPDAPLIADHPEMPARARAAGLRRRRAPTPRSRSAAGGCSRRRSGSSAVERRPGRPEASERGGVYALRPAARAARAPGRRERPSRRLGLDDGRPRGVAGACAQGGRSADAR